MERLKEEIKDELDEADAKAGEDFEDVLVEIADDGSPARPEIPFVDSSIPIISPKKESLEETKPKVPKRVKTTFESRWSSDEETELPELPDLDDEDISDVEIKQAIRNKNPKPSRAGWCRLKEKVPSGLPVCKYCELEFWTFRAKIEHMEICEFLQCDPKNFICRICCKELSKKAFTDHAHERTDCPHCNLSKPRNRKKRKKEVVEEQEVQEPKTEEPESTTVPEELPDADANDPDYQEEVATEPEVEPPPAKRAKTDKVKKKFDCDRCGKVLCSQQAMTNHIRLHLKKSAIICENCGADYYTRNGLTKHSCEKKRKRPEVDHRTYDQRHCRFCDSKFKNGDENKAHHCVNQDPADKKFVFCRICGKHLRKTVFNRHFETHSGIDWRCTICDRKLGTERALKIHIGIHTGNKPHQCQECPESFINKNSLTRHMRLHGAAIKTYDCEICSKQLSSRVRLRAHINRLHVELIICELCKVELPSKEELKFHLENEHEPSVCDVCGKTFVLPRYLKVHEKIHSEAHLNRIPDTKIACELCKKEFPSKELLKFHLEKDHGPSVCTICGKSFALPRYLKMHEKLHIEELRVKMQCSICLKLVPIKTIKSHVFKNHHQQFETWKKENSGI